MKRFALLGMSVGVLMAGCGTATVTIPGTSSSAGIDVPGGNLSGVTGGSAYLTFSGAISGPATQSSGGGCLKGSTASTGASFAATFEVMSGATKYGLIMNAQGYTGAGTYTYAPDSPTTGASLLMTNEGTVPEVYTPSSVTMTVNSDEKSGSLDASMTGSAGSFQVTGTWKCG